MFESCQDDLVRAREGGDVHICFETQAQTNRWQVWICAGRGIMTGGTCSRPHSLRKAYTTEKYGFLITAGSARLSLGHVPELRLGSGLRADGHVVGAIDPSIDPG